MKKILISILASLFMGFIGIVLGVLANEFFGAADIEFIPYVSTVFVIITMGAFIIHYNDKK